MNITVIGTGYVGLVAACCLANSGHHVVAVEKNLDKLGQLVEGVLPIYEEGLEAMFKNSIAAGRLRFSAKMNLDYTTVVIIAVGTPSLPDGRIDLSQVFAVAESIAKEATKPLTLVMKSTVPPGTGLSLNNRFFSLAKTQINYASNPEFLREGKAIQDWYYPDRIVIGAEQSDTAKLVGDLYSDIDSPRIITDTTSAEMIKYASNAFLATKISFINEIANLCEKVGANIDSVATAVGMDKRIGPHFLHAGLGYGGSCFPKDTRGLDFVSSFNGYNFSLLKAVIEVNARQRVSAVSRILRALKGATGKRIAVLGVAFKPGTDDIREAPALDIVEQLIGEGAVVTVSDPMALDKAKQYFVRDSIELVPDPYQACDGCEAIILATEWREFVDLDWGRIKKSMKAPYLIFDGRNALHQSQMTAMGFYYIGVGRIQVS